MRIMVAWIITGVAATMVWRGAQRGRADVALLGIVVGAVGFVLFVQSVTDGV